MFCKEYYSSDLQKATTWSGFYPESLHFEQMESIRQQEWEFFVSKLHGADLVASDEDLQTIKNLVNKLGR